MNIKKIITIIKRKLSKLLKTIITRLCFFDDCNNFPYVCKLFVADLKAERYE